MKDLAIELKKLDLYSGVECAEQILELYNEFPSDEKKIDEYIGSRVHATISSADETISKCVRHQLGEIAEILSLSYVARRYFNRSRQWLNHRINGSIVNGKPAKFTDDQLKTFNNALHDISKKIGSVNML